MPKPPTYILTVDELASLTGQTGKAILHALQSEMLYPLPGRKVGIPSQIIRDYLAGKGVDYSYRVIAHVNLKGGTGKTTSVITAATRAVQYGFKTCILDMDAQASASLAFGIVPEDDEPIFCDIWQRPTDKLKGALKPIEETLSILPSSLENSLLDLNLVHPASQKQAVRGVCEELRKHGFDLVLIDCPPSLSTAVISTICAADIVVIPVCADAFSMKGLELTLSEVASMCETFQIKKPVIKILYTKFDRRIHISVQALQRLSAKYEEYLVPVPIRTSSEFSKALEHKNTVFASTRQSHAKDDYDNYVKHLFGLNLLKT